MKVKCPSCKRLCFRTTDQFNPDVRPNRAMIEMLDPWATWGWDKHDGFMSSDLACPLCEAPLAPSGRLVVVPDDYQIVKVKTPEQINQEKIDAEWDEEEPCKETEPLPEQTQEPLSKADQIREYLKTDMSKAEIARKVGCSSTYVGNVAKKVEHA